MFPSLFNNSVEITLKTSVFDCFSFFPVFYTTFNKCPVILCVSWVSYQYYWFIYPDTSKSILPCGKEVKPFLPFLPRRTFYHNTTKAVKLLLPFLPRRTFYYNTTKAVKPFLPFHPRRTFYHNTPKAVLAFAYTRYYHSTIPLISPIRIYI